MGWSGKKHILLISFLIGIGMLVFAGAYLHQQWERSAFVGSDSYTIADSQASCEQQYAATGQVCFVISDLDSSTMDQLSQFFSDRLVQLSSFASSLSLVNNGDFENGAWLPVTNCSNASALWSTDSFSGNRSMAVTTSCPQVSAPIQFSNDTQYLVSFVYKGDAPRLCLQGTSGQICIGELAPSSNWTRYSQVLTYTLGANRSVALGSYGTRTEYDDVRILTLNAPFTSLPASHLVLAQHGFAVGGVRLSSLAYGTYDVFVVGPQSHRPWFWIAVCVLVLVLTVAIAVLLWREW